MTDREQTESFNRDLTFLIQRYINEFDLTTAQAVGVLAIKQHELIKFAIEDDDE